MGQCSVPSGPVGSPRTVTRGQQDHITCEHSHRLGLPQRRGQHPGARPGSLGHIRCLQGSFPARAEAVVQKQTPARVWAAARSCVPAEAALGKEEQDLGHRGTRARARRGHGQPPPLLLLRAPVCALPWHPAGSAGSERGCPGSGAGALGVPAAPGARRSPSPAPELPRRPRARPAGEEERLVPAPAHALVSSEPRMPRALSMHGRGEGFCRAAISISGPVLSCFPWTQGVF